jgi:hypothetical protein
VSERRNNGLKREITPRLSARDKKMLIQISGDWETYMRTRICGYPASLFGPNGTEKVSEKLKLSGQAQDVSGVNNVGID